MLTEKFQREQLIDEEPSGNQWMMGEPYTFADTHVLVFYSWSARLALWVLNLISYTAWKDRMTAGPAVRKVLGKEESLLLKAS